MNKFINSKVNFYGIGLCFFYIAYVIYNHQGLGPSIFSTISNIVFMSFLIYFGYKFIERHFNKF